MSVGEPPTLRAKAAHFKQFEPETRWMWKSVWKPGRLCQNRSII